MVHRLVLVLLAGVLLGLAGCGGDKDKGVHNNRDRPRAADKGER